MITIKIQEQDFNIQAEIEALRAGHRSIGALVTFTGLVREMNDGRPLTAMTLEHYPGMVERELTILCQEAEARWPLIGGTVIHRYGRLEVGDQIVLVATASAHRHAAFEAAMFLMDWLKTKAPFWKREESAANSQWVAAREEDNQAANRWDKR